MSKNTTKSSSNGVPFEPVVIGAPKAPTEIEAAAATLDDDDKKGKSVRKLKMIEDYLLTQFEFRYNEILAIPEIRPVDSKKKDPWKRMNDYTLNTIVREMKLTGISWASRDKVSQTIESNFCPKVNPIEAYFKDLEYDNSKDWIKEMTATVDTATSHPLFHKYFEKWVVGAVANVFEKDFCANHICLIMVGGQGLYKSTWLRNLCPPSLKGSYYYEGQLDPDNKDHLFETTANFIYNLDDYFGSVTKKKVNELKDLITKPKVKARRPYARYSEDLSKISSFAGTANETNFLYDSTGSRRFAPFEAVKVRINDAQNIEIDNLWAAAYKKYRDGFVYWVTDVDQKELEEHNNQFKIQTIECEMLLTCMNIPKDRSHASSFLTSTQILNHLEQRTKRTISQQKLGEALKELGYERWQQRDKVTKKRSWVYSVNIIDDAQQHYNSKNPDKSVTDSKKEESKEAGGKDDLPF